MPRDLAPDLVERLTKAFEADPTARMLQNAVTTTSVDDIALDRRVVTSIDHSVSNLLDDWSATSQEKPAALKGQGLAGKVPVGGQDGDKAALNNVALGNQTVSVWKNTSELGTAAGEAAVALCKDKDVTKVANTAPFTTPGGNTVTAQLLKPTPITKDNLQVVLDASWLTKAELCKDVAPATAPAGCK